MVPRLEFKEDDSESVGWFIEKSLQLHKAPKLDSLVVELGPHCPVDVDVGKWVENVVNRGVKELDFNLLWTAEPTGFPKCLYTCNTLVDLSLSNKILVNVSSPVRLPSLLTLSLRFVVYKDEESLVSLLSSSPVLNCLKVDRHKDDNLTKFTVKVSTLKQLHYNTTRRKDGVEDEEDVVEENEVEDDDDVDEVEDDEEGVVEEVDVGEVEEDDDDDLNRSLVIDSPALEILRLRNVLDYCLIENISCLHIAKLGYVHNPDHKFLRSLSSVIHMYLYLTKPMVAWCNTIKFSRLLEFYFVPSNLVDWLEPLMYLLQNSPKLQILTIDTDSTCLPPSWNQPSSSTIPECLLSHLQIFRWGGYGGREDEKQLMTYILANSKCLKRVAIFLLATCNLEETQMELESMPRNSTSSQLLTSSHKMNMFN
ncbi:unnamed protein product [Arabidopsis thaliana]|nr:unnamed protein product [Arabidopsis thaliana]